MLERAGGFIMANKINFFKLAEIIGDYADAATFWIEKSGILQGVRFETYEENGKKRRKMIWEGTAEVEVALVRAGATNVIKWIDQANREDLIIHDIGKEIRLNGDEVMFIMAEIPKDDRDSMYKKYDNDTKANFKKTLARLMVNKTKRMKFFKTWIEGIKPIINNIKNGLTLDQETLQQLDDYANRMNARAAELRQIKPKSKYAIIRFFQNLYPY